MKPNITQIVALEKHYKVKVLYACEAGSRAWGLESPYSDKDLGIIYHRSQEWYASILNKQDTIDLSLHTEFDGFGWDLRKILQGLIASNAVVYDWLQGHNHFISCPFTKRHLDSISQQCFDPRKVIFHYLGLGNNLIHKYKEKTDIQIKAYMLLIRSTLAAMWVKEKGTAPPILFSELLTIAESQPMALMPIHKIVMLKKQAKPDKYVPKISILDQFIKDNRNVCSKYAESLFPKDNTAALAVAEKLFHEVIFQQQNREALFDDFIKRDKKEA
ncbi:MAG: nucleotidyltransferase domain-containing protein [Saprospiraceae bacterium]